MYDNLLPEAISAWEKDVIHAGTSDQIPLNQCDFTPIGGDLGTDAEDFTVSEIPAYLPCGSGEHLYLKIQKRGKSTLDVLKLFEIEFGIKESDIGYAGKKDAHAVTEQWLSIRSKSDMDDALRALQSITWLKILEVSRHTNKLRLGHLRGNQFRIRLTDVTASDEAIDKALRATESKGFINYFGKQRFGFEGANAQRGIEILRGGKAPHQLRILYINAVQSAIFNLTAGRRFLETGFAICEGDVLRKHHAGCFVCEDPHTDAERAAQGEVTVMLPLPGKKVMHGRHFTEKIEQKSLEDFFHAWNLCDHDFSALNTDCLSRFADGDRREFWIKPEQMIFRRTNDNSIWVEFNLPSGSYATVLLRHLCGSSFSR